MSHIPVRTAPHHGAVQATTYIRCNIRSGVHVQPALSYHHCSIIPAKNFLTRGLHHHPQLQYLFAVVGAPLFHMHSVSICPGSGASRRGCREPYHSHPGCVTQHNSSTSAPAAHLPAGLYPHRCDNTTTHAGLLCSVAAAGPVNGRSK